MRNTIASALALVELFRRNWAQHPGRTAVCMSELDDAETLADRLETALGVRAQGPAGVPQAALARAAPARQAPMAPPGKPALASAR